MTRIVVGLSGGVDSAVAVYLLKEEGYDVVGLFMKNWDNTTGSLSGDCPWKQDRIDALRVAAHLGIPCKTVDFVKEYKERVVDYMFSEYEQGRTPNPDVLCNRDIKFDLFLKAALALKADFISTGHYCRKKSIKKDGKNIYRLLAGKDPEKDQSYFLCQLSQKQLEKTLFPLGDLLKSKVRKIAKKIGLPNAEKKDSQGICFVGKVDLPLFLQQQLKPKKGDIIKIPSTFEGSQQYTFTPEDGEVVGQHEGAYFFTIGQRKGLDVGGTKQPLFVLATDIKQNIVYVGEGVDHPALFRKTLFIQKSNIHFIREDLSFKEGEERDLLVRIRYRQPLQKAHLSMKDTGLSIIFKKPQRAVAAGQFAAWYDKEELLGSGVIE